MTVIRAGPPFKSATCCLPIGRVKAKQRVVARVYHLLAKEAAYAPNFHHIDDFRNARDVERAIRAQA